jgi:hypothetical protein
MFALMMGMPSMSELAGSAAHGVVASGHVHAHDASQQRTQLFNWGDEDKLHMDVSAPPALARCVWTSLPLALS